MAAAALALLFVPTDTRQGVDYVVTSRTTPLYAKALDFVRRDLRYRDLAARITEGRRTDIERVMAVYRWTRENIRDVPPGVAVVDDHIWNIVVRGYGTDDQKVDVFTTLATYGKARAFWTLLRPVRSCNYLPISLVQVDGRWIVLDVVNGIVFADARGRSASTEDLAGEPGIVSSAARGRRYHGLPYTDYFENFCPAAVPKTLRAEKQMPRLRLLFETRAMVGLEGRWWRPDLPLCDRATTACAKDRPPPAPR